MPREIPVLTALRRAIEAAEENERELAGALRDRDRLARELDEACDRIAGLESELAAMRGTEAGR